MTPRSPRPSPWTVGALALWACGMLAIGACAMALHLLALPAPRGDDPRLTAAIAARSNPSEWTVVHVLRSGCNCSRDVEEALLRRGPSRGQQERVVWVGGRAPTDLEGRGYRVERVQAEALHATFGVDGAPLLVIADPGGRVRYVGGYTRVKQGPVVEDTRILDELRAGGAPPPLPLFGCATDPRLRGRADPLGLR